MLLSICIPNYNRGKYLNNCLNSILIAKSFSSLKFEICISDNGSKENILSIIKHYRKKGLQIKFKKNKKNFGFGANFYKVVKMAKGEFIWLIGNDDLLYIHSLKELEKLFIKNKDVDFFFINSSILNSKFVFKHKQPFNTKKIPKKLNSFSKVKKNQKTKFFNLINPSISWDFMLAMFLTISRRKEFIKNIDILHKKKLNDPRVWSTIDNTAPHVKIFSYTFKNSNCYLQAKPLSVNLFGEKGWSHIYPFIMIIRIPELLDIYRKNGLPFLQYILYKNYALKRFVPYMYYIIRNKKFSNYKFISFKKNILNNILYPNIYIFGIYYVIKKIYNSFINNFK
ncbi:glycosyltransferase family 2 protein [Candidatus Pelagibacter ubique]|nr:glycosyltransferase family 2 protein [Candidatus Pelagibacter ubique]